MMHVETLTGMRREIVNMTTPDLVALVRSTDPAGLYAGQVTWAKQELGARGFHELAGAPHAKEA